eukprot:CAMPEP_0176225380 /NCGR_PEP_ID=MMETSP0121_2-20121125/21730_1 /TAXON_ID=160619 /ORGANISM="Kryptoperidinium foliaceum, Strain CCMP 1326" /LENGTH=73 /DNA_ID=CAMNT_0017564643 /DNA_START=36 /DNA_END=257 /DNA_ORIENTATION=-
MGGAKKGAGRVIHFSSSPLAFFNRLIVDLAVAAAPVVSVQHPPAIVLLHDLAVHCQMPPATRLTAVFPQNAHA